MSDQAIGAGRTSAAAMLAKRVEKPGDAPPVAHPRTTLGDIFVGGFGQVAQIGVEKIRRDETQARKTFDKPALEALALDLKENGVLSPLKVRKDPDNPDTYVLVFGERRWRAAQIAGLASVPAFVTDSDDRTREQQLSENFHRADLNPVELAEAVAQVMEEKQFETKAMAERYSQPLRKIQRLVEIHEAPPPVKLAIVKGIEVDGETRRLEMVRALDVIRAFRHWSKEDRKENTTHALGRLEKLIQKVLTEEWSSKKLQKYVGTLGQRSSTKPPPSDPKESGAEPRESLSATDPQDENGQDGEGGRSAELSVAASLAPDLYRSSGDALVVSRTVLHSGRFAREQCEGLLAELEQLLSQVRAHLAA